MIFACPFTSISFSIATKPVQAFSDCHCLYFGSDAMSAAIVRKSQQQAWSEDLEGLLYFNAQTMYMYHETVCLFSVLSLVVRDYKLLASLIDLV